MPSVKRSSAINRIGQGVPDPFMRRSMFSRFILMATSWLLWRHQERGIVYCNTMQGFLYNLSYHTRLLIHLLMYMSLHRLLLFRLQGYQP